MGAGAVIGGSLAAGAASGISSLIGGSQASSYDKAASDTAKQAYSYARSDLSPYVSAGQNALSSQEALAGANWGTNWYNYAATKEPSSVLTQSGLEQTPGYQFTMDQGLKQTQSAAAKRGLGVSGAALKGAAEYATGLASNTYSTRFNEAQTSFNNLLTLGDKWQSAQKNAYSNYSTLSSLGEQAGSSLAQAGTSAASTSASALTNAGNALSSATKGLGTSIGNALSDITGYFANKSNNSSNQNVD